MDECVELKLDRCFIKSWSTSGDADDRPTEEVAFYYNRISFGYAMAPDGDAFDSAGVDSAFQEIGSDQTSLLLPAVQAARASG